MSICVAGDKVYVATSPDLWVYEDKNGDLKADGPPKKLLTGFGGRNHDHGAHSLVLGPDHKWWMSHGDTGFDVTGTDGSQDRVPVGRHAARRARRQQAGDWWPSTFAIPTKSASARSAKSFLSDNDNDGNDSVRICWIMEGGNYGWFGGPPRQERRRGTPFREHWHFRGHIPGFVPATLVTGFGSPCGICFYEGDAFGPQYKNAPLHTDAGPREVPRLSPRARRRRHEGHERGLPDQRGRQLLPPRRHLRRARRQPVRLRLVRRRRRRPRLQQSDAGPHLPAAAQGQEARSASTSRDRTRSIADAIEGLKSPNLATQFLARERLLAEGPRSVPACESFWPATNPTMAPARCGCWIASAATPERPVIERLKNDDARMRALAVRILRRHGAEYADAILPLADDADPAVRREVLLALPAITGSASTSPVIAGPASKSEAAFSALVKLASTYDGSDRYLLEAINIAAANRKPKLYAALKDAGRVGLANLQLLRLLDPDAAAALLVTSMADKGTDDTARSKILRELGRHAIDRSRPRRACNWRPTRRPRQNCASRPWH